MFKSKEDIKAAIVAAIALLMFGSLFVLVLKFLYG